MRSGKHYRVPRYNLFPAAEILGGVAPGVASGTAMERMEVLAKRVLPPGISFEWTDLAHQQEQQGTSTLVIFAASALFVYLVLAAQYESWKMRRERRRLAADPGELLRRPRSKATLGHSAKSAQCPVCPKAEKAGRFMSIDGHTAAQLGSRASGQF
jgi:AcrB/AcrD/AcrF family